LNSQIAAKELSQAKTEIWLPLVDAEGGQIPVQLARPTSYPEKGSRAIPYASAPNPASLGM